MANWRVITTLFFVLIGFFATAQTIRIDRAILRQFLELRGVQIDSISKDSTFSDADNQEIPTAKSVKFYADNFGRWLGSELLKGSVIIKVPEDSLRNFIIDTLDNVRITSDGQTIIEKLGGTGIFEIISRNDSLKLSGQGLRIAGDSTVNILAKYLLLNGARLPEDLPLTAGEYVWQIDQSGAGAWINRNTFEPVFSNDILYVSSAIGNNSIAQIGNPRRPWSSPWVAKDFAFSSSLTRHQINIAKGNYTFSGPYNSTNVDRLTRGTDIVYHMAPGARISIENATTNAMGWASYAGFSDFESGTTGSGMNLHINGEGAALRMTRTSGYCLPIAIYNKESTLRGKLGSIIGGASSGEVWGMQFCGKAMNFEVDSISITGGVALSFNVNLGELTTPAGYTITRNVQWRANHILLRQTTPSETLGILRYQHGGWPGSVVVDSLSRYNIEVSSIESTSAGAVYFTPGNLFRMVGVDIVFNIQSFKNRVNFSSSVAAVRFEPSVSDALTSIRDSRITFRIGTGQIRGPIFTSQPVSNKTGLARKSVIKLDLGRIKNENTSNSTPLINLRNIVLRDSATIIIHCDWCESNESDVPYIALHGDSIGAGSTIIISGTFIQRGRNGAVVDIANTTNAFTNSGSIIFRDLILINNGAQPTVSSSVGVNINVAGAFQAGALLDSDVTFNRLNELGAPRFLTATATLDFGGTPIAINSFQDLTVTVPGAAVGDAVFLGVPNGSIVNNTSFFGWVSAADTVTIRCLNNDTIGTADPASGSYRVVVAKY